MVWPVILLYDAVGLLTLQCFNSTNCFAAYKMQFKNVYDRIPF